MQYIRYLEHEIVSPALLTGDCWWLHGLLPHAAGQEQGPDALLRATEAFQTAFVGHVLMRIFMLPDTDRIQNINYRSCEIKLWTVCIPVSAGWWILSVYFVFSLNVVKKYIIYSVLYDSSATKQKHTTYTVSLLSVWFCSMCFFLKREKTSCFHTFTRCTLGCLIEFIGTGKWRVDLYHRVSVLKPRLLSGDLSMRKADGACPVWNIGISFWGKLEIWLWMFWHVFSIERKSTVLQLYLL